MEDLYCCPVCEGTGTLIKNHKAVRDNSLTGEVFSISRCTDCEALITDPRPRATDIGRYYEFPDYVSHRDDAPGFINRLYQLARRYTTKQKIRLINSVINPTKEAANAQRSVLDYGCGTGFFLNEAKLNGWRTTGLEVNKSARDAAENRLGAPIASDLHDIAQHQKFDVITLWHVLEHIHDLSATFGTLVKHLETDGTIIVAVPNPESADALEYQEMWAAYDVPRHLYHFPAKAIQMLVGRHGGTVETMIGQPMDAYYIGLLSEKYRGGHALLGILNGFKSNIRALSNHKYSSIIYIIKFPTS